MDIHKLAGTTLGNYEIENLLGKGGMGVVYKARQISLNRNVALKILPPTLSSDESFVKRFQREAHAVARLNHPNIVHIYDIGEEEGLHFFSMEFVDGRPLDELVGQKQGLEADKAIEIISQASHAIEHAHENGIMHRDIKPSNIMIDNKGRVKVMDFGLARSETDLSRLTQTGTVLGTLIYMSPEQCLGEETDHRTDIYSLGVALYEMLAGTAPFTASNEAALIHKIIYDVPRDVRALKAGTPPGLSTVVARAMAKDKDDRYQSVSEFLKDIHNLQTVQIEQPARVRRSTAQKPPVSAKRRGISKKAKLAVIGLLAAVVALPIAALVIIYAMISSFDYNNLKTTIEQAVEDTTGRELAMPGDIEVKFGLTPSIIIEDISFQNAPWGSRPEMATIKRFELEAAILPLLSGNLVVRRLILDEPDIIIETSGSGESNIDFLSELKTDKKDRAPRSDAEQLKLTLRKMQIEKGRLTYRDGLTRKSYVVVLDELDASSKGGRSPVELELDGEYNGNPFELNGSVGPLTGIIDAKEPWRLSARAEAAWASVDVDGIITDVTGAKGIDLNVSLEGESIKDAASFFGIADTPDIGPYKLSARITDPSPGAFSLSNMDATLEQSNLSGSVEIATAGERPRLTASLKSRKMDLRPFMPEDENANNTSEKDKVFPDTPLPLKALNQLDAQLNVRARQVLLPRIALDDLDADIAIDSGTLAVKQMKASIGGGTLDSLAELRPNGSSADFIMKLKADRLDIGRMLKELDIEDVLEGELEADASINSSGGSVAELMAGLNGSTVVMGRGKIKNKYIEAFDDADLRSGVLRLLNPGSRETDYTKLNCFVSRFDITDGIARSTVLMADTNSMTVFGNGTADLKTERLDIELRPTPKKGAGAAAKISLNVTDLVKPFRLSGTLAEPELAIDPTLSAGTLGRAVLGSARSGSDGLAARLQRGETIENPCLLAVEAATGTAPPPQPEKEATEEISTTETQPAQKPLVAPKRRLKKLLRR